jgi:hypothetical protein
MDRENLAACHFKPLLKRAELPDIRLYNLRHTFATLWLESGEHPKILQEILGHSRISITLDTYSHVIPTCSVKPWAALGRCSRSPHEHRCGISCGTERAGRGKRETISPCFTCKSQYFFGALGRTRTCDLLIRSHSRLGTRAGTEGQGETKQRFYNVLARLEGQGGTGRDTRLRSELRSKSWDSAAYLRAGSRRRLRERIFSAPR